MTTGIVSKGLPRQSGIAAVEFALTLLVILVIGAGLSEFGRALWYYDAIAKGTRDAARHLSTIPTASLGAAVSTTANIVVDAASASAIPNFTSEAITVACFPTACGAAVQPTEITHVTVSAHYALQIGLIFPFLAASGPQGRTLTLAPHTTMPYMW